MHQFLKGLFYLFTMALSNGRAFDHQYLPEVFIKSCDGLKNNVATHKDNN